jgi:hypothetical protein
VFVLVVVLLYQRPAKHFRRFVKEKGRLESVKLQIGQIVRITSDYLSEHKKEPFRKYSS